MPGSTLPAPGAPGARDGWGAGPSRETETVTEAVHRGGRGRVRSERLQGFGTFTFIQGGPGPIAQAGPIALEGRDSPGRVRMPGSSASETAPRGRGARWSSRPVRLAQADRRPERTRCTPKPARVVRNIAIEVGSGTGWGVASRFAWTVVWPLSVVRGTNRYGLSRMVSVFEYCPAWKAGRVVGSNFATTLEFREPLIEPLSVPLIVTGVWFGVGAAPLILSTRKVMWNGVLV